MDYSKIILEMLNRIKTLEQEVAALKSKQGDSITTSQSTVSSTTNATVYGNYSPLSKRDTTRYLFEGNVYLKNRLVLAVVKAYVAQYKPTRQELKQVFDKSLQGSIGVVENVQNAQIRCSDYQARFFTRSDDVIHLSDGDMYVCTQWGIGNINNFIRRAEQLGFEIEPINI